MARVRIAYVAGGEEKVKHYGTPRSLIASKASGEAEKIIHSRITWNLSWHGTDLWAKTNSREAIMLKGKIKLRGT